LLGRETQQNIDGEDNEMTSPEDWATENSTVTDVRDYLYKMSLMLEMEIKYCMGSGDQNLGCCMRIILCPDSE